VISALAIRHPLLPGGARVGGRVTKPDTRNFAGEIFAAARPVIIKEILALHVGDLKDARAYTRYLESLKFTDLCARRDQLKREQLPIQLDLQPKYGGDR
jgi:hypothetical protein